MHCASNDLMRNPSHYRVSGWIHFTQLCVTMQGTEALVAPA